MPYSALANAAGVRARYRCIVQRRQLPQGLATHDRPMLPSSHPQVATNVIQIFEASACSNLEKAHSKWLWSPRQVHPLQLAYHSGVVR